MNSLLFYIISTSACLSLLILTYLLFLKNNTRFNLCRFYIIAAILFSFIIPFITIDIGYSFISNNEPIAYTAKPVIAEKIEVQELEAIPVQVESSSWNIDYKQIGGTILLSISLLLFVRFIFRFGSIILIKISGNRYEREDGTNLIFTDRTDNAFSFLGYIFINPLKFTDDEKRLIIEHEREHIRHFHSIDLILIELLIVLQWFNPFAYIARRKLIEIHEFIADNGVIQKGADPYSYQNLLLSVVSSSCLPTVGNQLSALITKKRIAMIGKPLNQTGRWINFLILVPIAIILIIGTSAFNPRPIEKNFNNEKTHTIKLTDSTTFRFLEKRAQNEIKDVWLKDFSMDLAPNSSQSYSIILKKGEIYNVHLLSGNKDEKLGMKIVYNKSETEKETVADNIFKYSQLSFLPNKTGSFTIIISNPTAINKKALLVLTLKGTNEIVKNTSNNQNLQDTGNDKEEPFMVVEQMPVFGNGKEDEFKTWITTNLQYPKIATENGIQGRVFVQFIIEKDGSITNAKVIRGVDPALDKEALRIIQLSPKWNPGTQRGKPVRVQYTFPITFVLN